MPDCGIKFVDFRNNHRLGCSRDYQVFQNELLPLLENIHGETRHVGKTPRRYPQTKKAEAELVQLRGRLKRAVDREDYEKPPACAIRSRRWKKFDPACGLALAGRRASAKPQAADLEQGTSREMPPVWTTGDRSSDRDRQRQEEGKALLPRLRPEAGSAQAAAIEPHRLRAIDDRAACRRVSR